MPKSSLDGIILQYYDTKTFTTKIRGYEYLNLLFYYFYSISSDNIAEHQSKGYFYSSVNMNKDY